MRWKGRKIKDSFFEGVPLYKIELDFDLLTNDSYDYEYGTNLCFVNNSLVLSEKFKSYFLDVQLLREKYFDLLGDV